MSQLEIELPWAALELRGEEIRWDDLRRIGDAAVQSSEIRQRLVQRLDEYLLRRYLHSEPCTDDLTDLAIPAVFVMIGDRLDPEARRDLAEYLIALLYDVGEADDDIVLEAVFDAARAMGTALIEPVLRLLSTSSDSMGCWFHLWSLLAVAKDADASTRRKLCEICRNHLAQASADGEPNPDAIGPAELLALLEPDSAKSELAELMAKLQYPEMAAMFQVLEGQPQPLLDELDLSRTRSVEVWLPQRIREARESLEDDADRAINEAEWVDDDAEIRPPRYSLTAGFEQSDEYRSLPDDVRAHSRFAVEMLQSLADKFIGIPISRLVPANLEKILIEHFPGELSAERVFFENASQVLIAFLRWMEQRGELQDASRLVNTVTEAEREMLRRSQDPGYWGPEKKFLQEVLAGEFDDDNVEAIPFLDEDEDDSAYGPMDDSDLDSIDSILDATKPIVSKTPKIGRNDPCPCGSGKKFKKCCGP